MPSFATHRLPSVSVRLFSIATMRALRLLQFRRTRLLWRLANRLLPPHPLVSLTWRLDASALRRDVVNPVSSPTPGFRCGRELEFSQVHRVPFSCAFAVALDPGGTLGGWPFFRRLALGLCWVNGKDSSQLKTFEARSHGFGARCQRFVPASRLTTHDSLPAAWLHALSGQDFYLLGSFSEFPFHFVLHVFISSLSVFILAQ